MIPPRQPSKKKDLSILALGLPAKVEACASTMKLVICVISSIIILCDKARFGSSFIPNVQGGRQQAIHPLRAYHPPERDIPGDHSDARRVEKESEEPLSLMFQRAVVWQRAGDYERAMEEYHLILKAAQQVALDVSQYAEVHVNLGALYLRQYNKTKGDNNTQQQARYHFETALQRRNMGVAHVNLAVLLLQELTSLTTARDHPHDKKKGREMLQRARDHCQQALVLRDDSQAQVVATRLLGDIEKMMRQL